ncbi:hypothetical protein VPHD148_0268 [Vibrio phage D148]
MDKVAKLKSIAKGLATAGAGGILGAGAGIAASDQIQKNKNNARTRKGWETRRRRAASEK